MQLMKLRHLLLLAITAEINVRVLAYSRRIYRTVLMCFRGLEPAVNWSECCGVQEKQFVRDTAALLIDALLHNSLGN